jgi:hypothetical protein
MTNTLFEPITYRRDLSNYLINPKGEIYSFYVHNKLKPQIDISGYYTYVLTTDKGNKIKVMAHIAVAKQYIPNDDPEHKTIVNHKDENKQNPSIENLEWVTPKENANHGTRNERSALHRRKPVNEYDINGRFIRTWRSIKDVAEFFVGKFDVDTTEHCIYNAISGNCNGKSASAFGRIWKTFDGDTSDITPNYGIRNDIGLAHSKSKLSLCYDGEIPSEYLYQDLDINAAKAYFLNNERLTQFEKEMLKKIFGDET